MRVNVLRHSCNTNSFANMLQTFIGNPPDGSCPFYWRMKGGKTYMGSIHYFTFFGIRIVLNLAIKKTVEVNRKYRPKFQWPLKHKDYGDESLK